MDNLQLRVCPFCRENPVVIQGGRYCRIGCKNPNCEVQPRTSWHLSIEWAIEIWEGKAVET